MSQHYSWSASFRESQAHSSLVDEEDENESETPLQDSREIWWSAQKWDPNRNQRYFRQDCGGGVYEYQFQDGTSVRTSTAQSTTSSQPAPSIQPDDLASSFSNAQFGATLGNLSRDSQRQQRHPLEWYNVHSASTASYRSDNPSINDFLTARNETKDSTNPTAFGSQGINQAPTTSTTSYLPDEPSVIESLPRDQLRDTVRPVGSNTEIMSRTHNQNYNSVYDSFHGQQSRVISHNNPNQRPFSCDWPECPSAFTRKADLDRHKRHVHERQRNFPCPYTDCARNGDKSFSRRDHLKEHLRKVHKERDSKKKRNQKSHDDDGEDDREDNDARNLAPDGNFPTAAMLSQPNASGTTLTKEEEIEKLYEEFEDWRKSFEEGLKRGKPT